MPTFEGGSIFWKDVGIPWRSTEAVPRAQWTCPGEYLSRSWRYLASSSEYVGSSSELVPVPVRPRSSGLESEPM